MYPLVDGYCSVTSQEAEESAGLKRIMKEKAMSLIQWNATLSVGVQSLDKEHQQLVELVNRMHEAMQTGQGKNVVGEILEKLIHYTQTHFKHEEELMTKTAYPQASVHTLHHTQLTKKVVEFREQFLSGKVTLSMEVMNFLKSWLQDHILKMDKGYTQHFQSRGIK